MDKVAASEIFERVKKNIEDTPLKLTFGPNGMFAKPRSVKVDDYDLEVILFMAQKYAEMEEDK